MGAFRSTRPSIWAYPSKWLCFPCWSPVKAALKVIADTLDLV